ncbi:MAG: HAD family hydrolase [Oscillospiraceae bacterium]|jgi:phosphoglycolate phosphatase|nr:HAD family hydrolase [Oscillospiraceae bacterium]MCI9551440.1 HAD family hydrolase [Oscillospiraceae bacterium]
MSYHGVFFDFDYTLGDSTAAIAEGYRLGFLALGLDPPTEEQVRHTVGLTLADGYALLTGDHNPERQEAFYHSFQHTVGVEAGGEGRRLMIEGTTLFPGAEELLLALKHAGVRTAIVSTKPGSTIRRIFEHQGRKDLLDLVVGGDEVTQAKPHPQGLRLALERLGLSAEQVLFCGDTVIDAATAQAGGCDFCAVLNGTTKADAFERFPCVHTAPDLAELKRWLKV